MNSDLYKIDFGRGKIEFNDIDNLKIGPLAAQLDNLKEDLLQVSYPNGFLLDVGWYPSFDMNGNFQIRVVKNHNWDKPIYFEETTTVEVLFAAIRKATSLINNM